jgi:hypothetical protein
LVVLQSYPVSETRIKFKIYIKKLTASFLFSSLHTSQSDISQFKESLFPLSLFTIHNTQHLYYPGSTLGGTTFYLDTCATLNRTHTHSRRFHSTFRHLLPPTTYPINAPHTTVRATTTVTTTTVTPVATGRCHVHHADPHPFLRTVRRQNTYTTRNVCTTQHASTKKTKGKSAQKKDTTK